MRFPKSSNYKNLLCRNPGFDTPSLEGRLYEMTDAWQAQQHWRCTWLHVFEERRLWFTSFLCFFFSFLLHNLSGANGWEVPWTTMGFIYLSIHSSGVVSVLGDRQWVIIWEETPSGVGDRVQSATSCCCFYIHFLCLYHHLPQLVA